MTYRRTTIIQYTKKNSILVSIRANATGPLGLLVGNGYCVPRGGERQACPWADSVTVEKERRCTHRIRCRQQFCANGVSARCWSLTYISDLRIADQSNYLPHSAPWADQKVRSGRKEYLAVENVAEQMQGPCRRGCGGGCPHHHSEWACDTERTKHG